MPKQLKKVGSTTKTTRTRAPKPVGREPVSRSVRGFERATSTAGAGAKKRAPRRPTRQRSY